MDVLIAFLTDYGYWGMLVAAFLAGSFVPFSSEAVMVALMAAGLNPWELLAYASVGNSLGSFFNYAVGRMGRPEWIGRWLHVKPAAMQRAQRFVAGHGAWIGFFAFIPVLGSAITIALGLMRANVLISFLSIVLGKTLRYLLLVCGVEIIF